MATYARPTSDTATGVWLTQSGSTSSLYAQIDETTHSESDYAECSLAGPTGIPDQAGNVITYTTPLGTACTYRGVWTGGVQDDYHYALLFLPDTYVRSAGSPMVWYFHGATANEMQVLPASTSADMGPNDMLNSWLDAGWAVMSFRLGTSGVIDRDHDNNDGKWGNTLVRQACVDAYAWVQSVFTVHPNGLLFYGFSAGGTNSVNALLGCQAAGKEVAALAICDPATNVRAAYDKNYLSSIPHTQSGMTANVRSQIIAAYSIPLLAGGARPYAGTPASAEWIAQVDTPDGGHDPQQVTLSSLPQLPVSIVASSADTTVSKALHADMFNARLAAYPWTAELTYTQLTSGNHGARAHFQATETKQFFDRALV